jgi:hypothetical protein
MRRCGNCQTTGGKSIGEMVEFLKQSGHRRSVVLERTDRLYRNFRDALTLAHLEADIHFVKENQIIADDQQVQAVRQFVLRAGVFAEDLVKPRGAAAA